MNSIKNSIEAVDSSVVLGIQKGYNRSIAEPTSNIDGIVAVTVGRWHDSSTGALLVNGRQGFYTYATQPLVDNLLTEDGRDEFHAQDYTNTSAGNRGSGFIAVSAETTAPVVSDTSLAGEITTGGLTRVDAGTKTHVNDTNTTTIATTFTASATHTDVHKAALFNAISGVTMSHAAVFTSDVTLAINDTLTVTWTLTLG